MKTIIAGSRDASMQDVRNALAACPWTDLITEVISGTARGADRFGEQWADENSIPVDPYPAEWDKYGKGAGMRRNYEMAANAEALIAIWDGVSPGTKHMIRVAEEQKLRVFIFGITVREELE